MSGDKLFESFGFIDDELVERGAGPAKRRGRYAALAASLALVIGAVALAPRLASGGEIIIDSPDPVTEDAPGPAADSQDPVNEGTPDPDDSHSEVTEPPASNNGADANPGEPDMTLPEPPQPTEPPELHWNDVQPAEASGVPLRESPIMFSEELTEDELLQVRALDGFQPVWDAQRGLYGEPRANVTGTARYMADGSLYDVFLTYSEVGAENTVTITLRPKDAPLYRWSACIVGEESGPVTSALGALECTAYRTRYGDEVVLDVDFVIGDVRYLATVSTDLEREAEDRLLIESAVTCYRRNAQENVYPDLTRFKMRLEHKYIDEHLPSLDEARRDPEFGAFVPASAPGGFRVGDIYRYAHEDGGNYMSVDLNDGGYRYLNMIIQYAGSEDLERLVDVTRPEMYDMSLYSIPLTDSVPGELGSTVANPVFRIGDLTQEVVNARAYSVSDSGDTDGPRMSFEVLYGGVTVRITSKGVDPEWIYDLLSGLG